MDVNIWGTLVNPLWEVTVLVEANDFHYQKISQYVTQWEQGEA